MTSDFRSETVTCVPSTPHHEIVLLTSVRTRDLERKLNLIACKMTLVFIASPSNLNLDLNDPCMMAQKRFVHMTVQMRALFTAFSIAIRISYLTHSGSHSSQVTNSPMSGVSIETIFRRHC
jgi:hypothetical protein